jgi:hypothetical protein
LRLTACACPAEHYRRVRRKRWMRLFPSRRLYRCLACDAALFIPLLQAIESPFGDTSPQRDRGGDAPGRRPSPAGS